MSLENRLVRARDHHDREKPPQSLARHIASVLTRTSEAMPPAGAVVDEVFADEPEGFAESPLVDIFFGYSLSKCVLFEMQYRGKGCNPAHMRLLVANNATSSPKQVGRVAISRA